MNRAEADENALVRLMFGAGDDPARPGALRPPTPPDRAMPHREETKPLLVLRGACARASEGEAAITGLDLAVSKGEILGVAGVSGNGQKELGDLILGLRPLRAGSGLLGGAVASGWPVRRVRAGGVAFIPEDPLSMAAVPGMSVRENLVLGTGRRYARGVAVDWRALEADMLGSFRRLGFAVPALDAPIRALSGGNLQRTVIAREMALDPRLVVALYPTRGLDVRSAASVRELLRRVRDAGGGILLISEDLEELFEMSDRLLVMYCGRIAGEFSRGAWDAATVGHLMTGSKEGAHAG